MHFSFYDLVEHIGTTRSFTAGTLLGSGTVSNEDPEEGISCLAERYAGNHPEHGAPSTPFLQPGDRVQAQMSTALDGMCLGQSPGSGLA